MLSNGPGSVMFAALQIVYLLITYQLFLYSMILTRFIVLRKKLKKTASVVCPETADYYTSNTVRMCEL